jgi:hypothetical protein
MMPQALDLGCFDEMIMASDALTAAADEHIVEDCDFVDEGMAICYGF